MKLINELRMLAEDLYVNGYSRYASAMSNAADELAKWETVFGHLGDTPDECGNAIIAARDELEEHCDELSADKGTWYRMSEVFFKRITEVEEALKTSEERCATLTDALHQISLCSQNSMSSHRECGRLARAALGIEMNDRELLELAAKAQGWFDYPTDSIEQGHYWHTDREKAPFDHCFPKEDWNPLEDDGDALRLAVKLGIELVFTRNKIGAGRHSATSYLTWANEDRRVEDPYAATRRAIVRAAAEIGRNMK